MIHFLYLRYNLPLAQVQCLPSCFQHHLCFGQKFFYFRTYILLTDWESAFCVLALSLLRLRFCAVSVLGCFRVATYPLQGSFIFCCLHCCFDQKFFYFRTYTLLVDREVTFCTLVTLFPRTQYSSFGCGSTACLDLPLCHSILLF